MCEALFAQIAALPHSVQKKLDTGEVLANIDRSRLSFSNVTHSLFLTICPIVFEILVAVFLIWKVSNLLFASVFFVALLLLFALAYKISQVSHHQYNRVYSAQNMLMSHLVGRLNTLYDMKINKAYAKEMQLIRLKLSGYVRQMFGAHLKMGTFNLIQVVAVWLVLCGSVMYLLSTQTDQASSFVTIISYILQLTAPLVFFAHALMNLKGEIIALNTGLQYFNEEAEPQTMQSKSLNNQKVPALFRVSNLVLPYSDHSEPISFEIHEGCTTLIKAASGFGKSTLINILLKLECDYRGSVEWLGEQIQNSNSIDLINAIAFVPQMSVVIEGSLRDNLLWGTEEEIINDQKLLDTLKAVSLDYLCDENNLDDPNFATRTLSGGEKQRLSIARAVLRGKSIVILDEPTSALDQATAIQVMSFLKNKTKTLIIISHQAWVDQYADEIINLGE